MNERTPYIKRGWQLSGMELAFEIAERANPRDYPEFIEANALNDEGKLFEKFTGKRCSQAADAQLLQWHNDLHGARVDQDIIAAEVQEESNEVPVEGPEPEPVDDAVSLDDPHYADALSVLRTQGKNMNPAVWAGIGMGPQ